MEIALLLLFHGAIADQLSLLSEIKATGKNADTYKDKAYIFLQRHLLKGIPLKVCFVFFLNTFSFSKSSSLTSFYILQNSNETKPDKNKPQSSQLPCNPLATQLATFYLFSDLNCGHQRCFPRDYLVPVSTIFQETAQSSNSLLKWIPNTLVVVTWVDSFPQHYLVPGSDPTGEPGWVKGQFFSLGLEASFFAFQGLGWFSLLDFSIS